VQAKRSRSWLAGIGSASKRRGIASLRRIAAWRVDVRLGHGGDGFVNSELVLINMKPKTAALWSGNILQP
jgi:hypothetical protein